MSTKPKATATASNIVAAVADTAILAANGGANGRSVQNDSTATLYLKYGTGASATSHTVKIPPNTLYEFPQPLYQGVVNGFWDAANGSARATEW